MPILPRRCVKRSLTSGTSLGRPLQAAPLPATPPLPDPYSRPRTPDHLTSDPSDPTAPRLALDAACALRRRPVKSEWAI